MISYASIRQYRWTLLPSAPCGGGEVRRKGLILCAEYLAVPDICLKTHTHSRGSLAYWFSRAVIYTFSGIQARNGASFHEASFSFLRPDFPLSQITNQL